MVLGPETQGEKAHVESITQATSALAGIRNDCTSGSRSDFGRRRHRRPRPGQEKQSAYSIHRNHACGASLGSSDYAPLLGGTVPTRRQQFSRVSSEALAGGTARLANHPGNLLQGEDLQRMQSGTTAKRFQRGTEEAA